MPKLDTTSSTPMQLIANEILKIMFESPAPEEHFHVLIPSMPDDVKIQPHWTTNSIFGGLRNGQDISLTEIGEALKMLHEEDFITLQVGTPTGFELLEKGRTEAMRLGAKPAR